MSTHHKKFKTEVQQLLDLVIHSLYSNREIFLRELVSNASDAIDRARFEALSKPELLEGDPEWDILITADPQAKTLVIQDNGIGMTAEEVEKNIGTIASSGTRRFLQEVKGQGGQLPPELIGQFGVGFYSAFMVADRVELVTRHAGQPASAAIRWESTGDGEYTTEETVREKRGTTITLHLKADAAEFLEEWEIRKIVKKYSDFVEHPVRLLVVEAPSKDEDGKPAAPRVPEVINSRKALWQRPKSELTEEEYQEFYKIVGHDFTAPLETLHWGVEGTSEFKALLYIPERAGFDFFSPDAAKRGVHLYVKRVFITDNCEALRPEYLRFLRGVVDSADLPLNVSRELLQENRLVRTIKTNLAKKVLDTLAEMKEKRREKYETFWNEFGVVLKQGLREDFANAEKIKELMLFESATGAPGKRISLAEYVALMPEAQSEIYVATGESRQALENSPHLEAFRQAGFDVLFLTDPVDEWLAPELTEYKEKKLRNVTRGGVELPAAAAPAAKPVDSALIAALKQALGERVKDVKESRRLTDSACCLVYDEHALSPQMERVYKAMGRPVPAAKGVLEINAAHPLVEKLAARVKADAGDAKIAAFAEMLYDQALLTSGQPVADLLAFTKRVSQLMAETLG